MVHEPFLAFGHGPWRQNIAALVHRLMTIVLLRAAHRIWVSIPEWERRWRPYALGRPVPFQWLPIPSNIPVTDSLSGIQAVRRRFVPAGHFLIGHFGTYGAANISALEPILLRLRDDPRNRTVLLMGMGSESFRDQFIRKYPELGARISATGTLTPDDLSSHITACDLLIQPYIDGVSTRRTSFMVGLAHGKAIVTTAGQSTEPLWAPSGAVALASAGSPAEFVELLDGLCADDSRRARMSQAAKKLYWERFDISHSVAALLQTETEARERVCV
jgi:glycosyltransferase involved in cell wall biosynthesis